MKKFLSILLSVGLLAGAFAACGNTTTTDTNTTEPTTSTSATGDKTIYFVSKTLGNQYWSVVEDGARAAANDLGVNLVVTGLANEAEVEKQIQLLQDAASASADGIVVGPTDSIALATQVEEIYGAGIPIVVVDTMIATENYSGAFLTDNVAAGRVAAEEMIERLKKTGLKDNETAQVAIQQGASGSQTTIDRIRGFNEYWEANAPKAWVVLNDDIKTNDGDISKAIGFTQDFITTYPDLKAVFGPNNGSTVGFVTGLKEADRKDIVMIGFDYSDDIKTMIEEGEYNVASIVQQQYQMGYQAVAAAVSLSKGETLPEKTVDTGVMVVDKNNLNSAEVQEVLNPGK